MGEQAALMAEALADVALAKTIATADADNIRHRGPLKLIALIAREGFIAFFLLE
jgi:hypothetical protein